MTRPLLPEYTTPAELAAHLGVSERALRERAREIGACRVFGKRLILLAEDVAALVGEGCPIQPPSNGSAERQDACRMTKHEAERRRNAPASVARI